MLELIAILLILLGFFLLVISSFSGAKVYWGVGGFIGPIPFGFSNNPYILILIIFLMILVIFFYIVWK